MSYKDFKEKNRPDIVIPIVSHTGREGTFINCDDFIQFSSCEIKRDIPSIKILDLVEIILNDGISSCEKVWSSGLSQQKFLNGISLFKVKSKTVKIEIK